jgi:hypothetical protein
MRSELFPEEEDKLSRIESMVSGILQALHGEPAYKRPGLLDDIEKLKLEFAVKVASMEVRMGNIEQNNRKWMFGVVCFAVGILVAVAIVFGLSLKDIKSFLK